MDIVNCATSASKCDDISCSEVIRALRLEDEPVLVDIEDRLDRHLEEISEAKKAKRQAEKTAKGKTLSLQPIYSQLHGNFHHRYRG